MNPSDVDVHQGNRSSAHEYAYEHPSIPGVAGFQSANVLQGTALWIKDRFVQKRG